MNPVVLALSVLWLASGSEFEEKPRCDLDNVPEAATKMVCQHFTSEFDLYQELSSIRSFDVRTLVIQSSDFRFFTHDSFWDMKLQEIDLKNCSILDLTDSSVAFEGLENHLETLSVQDASFVDSWNWSLLKNLKKLKYFTVSYSELSGVPENFQDISSVSLEKVDLRENAITWIHDRAFSKFMEMTYLFLSGNEITSLKRSMFPKPSKLQGLHLSYNKVKTFPADMFTDMPDFNKIVLSNNPIQTLDVKVFARIWGQMDVFLLTDSSLRCDCRLKWLTRAKRKSGYYVMFCESPSELRKRFVLTLKPEELWC